MKINRFKFSLVFLVFMAILVSCGGGSSPGSEEGSDLGGGSGSGISGLNGLITFEEHDVVNEDVGVISFELSKGNHEQGFTVVTGKFPYRHPNGKVVYSQKCGRSSLDTKISVVDTNGLITPITPCITELSNTMSLPYYEYAKLSPDESMIAVEVVHGVNKSSIDERMYSIFVYDLNGQEIERFSHFNSPEWLPDGRLMLLGSKEGSYGIYTTDYNLKNISQLDTGNRINSPIINADVSPSGEKVIFEYSKQIWMMNMDGTGLEALIRGNTTLVSPTWSPDGKYIAYLSSFARNTYHPVIYFYDVRSKSIYQINTNKIFSGNGKSPRGPVSWTK